MFDFDFILFEMLKSCILYLISLFHPQSVAYYFEYGDEKFNLPHSLFNSTKLAVISSRWQGRYQDQLLQDLLQKILLLGKKWGQGIISHQTSNIAIVCR